MLQAIRNNAQGVFVWIVVGLIVVSFALFGLGSYLSGASKVVAASVNGVEISGSALTRAYQQYQERLRSMLGEQYRPEMFGTKRVKAEVLQGLVTKEVVNQMLNEQGYTASSEQVFDKIKQFKAFQEGGVFSPKRYKEVLSLQGMNGQAFENDLSRDIASQQLNIAISASSFLTQAEKENLAKLQNQKRNIGYYNISVNSYRNSIKVSDEDIKSYYEKNTQSYLTDEKVQVEYLELQMEKVAAQQEVSAEMIQQQYESSPESYTSNDDAATKKKLLDIRKQIQQGASFASLAKKYSQDKGSAKQGGDLGYLTKGVEENFDKVVFALKKGELSDLIKTKTGFQLVQLNDIREGDPEERKVSHILINSKSKLKPLASVKAEIQKELQLKLASKVFFDDADQLNNLSYETPDSLVPVAEALGLELKTGPMMTRRGNAGLFANPKVLSAAFNDEVLKKGQNSELLELSDTHLVVLRIKEHKPTTVVPLTNVKSKIKNTLLQQQASKKAQDVASDVLTRVKNNESLSEIQKTYPEIKWNKTAWINRKVDTKSNIPDVLRQHTFAMAKPNSSAVWDKLRLYSGDQAVVGLYKVESSADAIVEEERITQTIGKTDYSSFLAFIKSQSDISISQQAIDTEDQTN